MNKKNIKNRERKTAFVLGGGGSRGAYEIGVWQALREMGTTFDMVYGTSIGAINGAMVVQDTFDDILALWKDLDTSTVFELESDTDLANAIELIQKGGGTLHGLKKILVDYLDEDLIRKSPMDYGVTTVEFPNLKPHYLTKNQIPEGKMMDFICASASCFPAIHAYEIEGKKYIDGGYADNVPVGMASLNGATDIISVNLHSIGLDPRMKLPKGTSIVEIGSKWDLGNFMFFKRDNITKIMRLGYLETLKAFDTYEGMYYTFFKNEIESENLHIADRAAKIFSLDPEKIYKKEVLHNEVKQAIEDHSKANNDYQKENFGFSISALLGKLVEGLAKAKADVHPVSITLAIANDLKNNKLDHKKLNPAIFLIIKDELDTALYLVKEGLY